MFDLTGKKALVTGATGGIGRAIAEALSAQGAELVLSGTRQPQLEELASLLGRKASIITANLSNMEEAEQLVERAETQAGPLDILICNAGVTRDTLALRMKYNDFHEIVAINLEATFLLNREAMKRMLKRKWGRIINISSVVAVTGNPGQANYVAAKAGMIGMTKSLAAEVATRGVTINCIAPGFIKSPMTEGLTDVQKEKILQQVPMAELGEPKDIAHGVVYLASQEASYITGQTLHINGGMVMV